MAEALSFGWAVAAGSAVFSAGRAGAKALPATPPRMTSGARSGPCRRRDGMAATFSFATAGKGSPMAMIDGVCGAGVPSVTMDGVAAGKHQRERGSRHGGGQKSFYHLDFPFPLVI